MYIIQKPNFIFILSYSPLPLPTSTLVLGAIINHHKDVFFNKLHLLIYLCYINLFIWVVWVLGGWHMGWMFHGARMKARGNLPESAFCFHHVGLGHWTQIIMLDFLFFPFTIQKSDAWVQKFNFIFSSLYFLSFKWCKLTQNC